MKVSRIIKFVYFLLVFETFFITILWSDESKFGVVGVKLDNKELINYEVKQALLYRKVSIEYDSTILIQNQKELRILYIPQLSSGKGNILRIILRKFNDQSNNFLDIFFHLADTIRDTLIWEDVTNKIFMTASGNALPFKQISKQINGKIIFTRNDDQEIISGKLGIDFYIGLFDSVAHLNHIFLDGYFTIMVGDYRRITLEESLTREERRKRISNITQFGIITSIFIFVYFILR